MEHKSNISYGGTRIYSLSLRKALTLGRDTMSAWKWVIFESTGEKHLARLEHTPLYEKGIKKTQNKPMETTSNVKESSQQ